MEEETPDYRAMLESKRLDIIQNLQVDRTFLFDYLRSKGALDAEDCELVYNEKTTARKVGKFVDILARKGPGAYEHLLESLQLENPTLYKILTGKDANATANPIMTKLKNSYLGLGDPLGNGELGILSEHLERTYGDLIKMSCRFEQVVQRKKSIEDQLGKTIGDLKRNQEKVEDLQKKIDNERGTSSIHQGHLMRCLQYMDTLRKEKSDRDIYIIALQTKLMSAKEEVVELEKKNTSMAAKNTELLKVYENIKESYKMKKCESLRLSERIMMQGGEIKKAGDTMRKYRECQFENMKLREEYEHLQAELNEQRKFTTALEARYEVVESEKTKTMTYHSAIIADFGSARNELMQCKEELSDTQLLVSDLEERVRHLELDKERYKKQRDAALTARRDAVLDKDKALLERDQAKKQYDEVKANKEAVLETNILQLKSFDEVVARNDVLEEEVKCVRMKLRQTERELEETKMKCHVMDIGENDDSGQNEPREMVTKQNKESSPKDQVTHEESGPGNNKMQETGRLVEVLKPCIKQPPEFLSMEVPSSRVGNAGTFPLSRQQSGEWWIDREKGFQRRNKTRTPIRKPRPGLIDTFNNSSNEQLESNATKNDMDMTSDVTHDNVTWQRSMSVDNLTYVSAWNPSLDLHDHQP